MTEDRKGIGDIISTVTIAVLFLVILMLVVFSAMSYKHATDVQNENNNRRAVLSYVVSVMRTNERNGIEIWDKDGAKGISISEPGSKYERRIFVKGGKLMEEYTEKEHPLNTEDSTVIGETEVFDVKEIRSGVFEIKTDLGTSYVTAGE